MFKVKFRCDRNSTTCAFISFGIGNTKRTIRGKLDATNRDVSVFIPKIAKFLENCHVRWLDFINQKREENYILNFFTIEQMVILQEELVKMGFDDETSDLVYPLLSGIKQGCTRGDLVEAMNVASLELKGKDLENQELNAVVSEEVAETEVAKTRFIEEIMDAGNSKALAMEALKHFSPDQIDDGN